jgi:hypothetical protein
VEALEGRALLANLVVNGDFEAGRVGFSSDYTTGDLVAAGSYVVARDPAAVHPEADSYGDHTSGSGLMMAVNGSLTEGVVVWSQTVPVSPGADYQLSAWISTWLAISPGRLEFSINGTPMGTATAPSASGVWQRFGADWNAGPATSATITIVDRNTDFSGNDVALDDISFIGPDPDLAATSLARDEARLGVTFGYEVVGASPDRDATVDLFWAAGPTAADRIRDPVTGDPLPPAYSTALERPVGRYGPFFVPDSALGPPPAGATHLLLVVDSANTVAESDEVGGELGINNVRSLRLPDRPSPPPPDRPDLSVASPPVPLAATAGRDLTASLDIRNTGRATAGGMIEVGYYLLGDDGPLGVSAIRLGAFPLPLDLSPGQALPFTATIAVPASVRAGSYRLVAKVDDGNAIDEGDEANNSAVVGLLTVRALSGAGWVGAFPVSTSLGALEPTFAADVSRFIQAVTNGGAGVRIRSTLMPPERAHLMHWSWLIAKRGYPADAVPPMEGVSIEWWHGDQARSLQAAREMVDGFGTEKLRVAPALESNPTRGLAIDMAITWAGNLSVIDGHGRRRTIRGGPRDSTNPRLMRVGATFGVMHDPWSRFGRDRWSVDGR